MYLGELYARQSQKSFQPCKDSSKIAMMYGCYDMRGRSCILPRPSHIPRSDLKTFVSDSSDLSSDSDSENSQNDSDDNAEKGLKSSNNPRKKYQNDYSDEEIECIPTSNYPYKSSRHSRVSKNTNYSNKSVVSAVAECLKQTTKEQFSKRVMDCFRQHMTNVTVLDFSAESQSDSNYINDLNNFEVIDNDRLEYLAQREMFSFLNDMEAWVDIFDRGQHDSIKYGLPIMGERILEQFKRTEKE